MAASPRSTVLSDLYSPELKETDFGQGFSNINDSHPSSRNGVKEPEQSDYSETMQGLDSPCEDISITSSAGGGPGSGISFETSHKRKRDSFSQSENDFQEYTQIPDHQEGRLSTQKVDSFGSMEESPNPWHDHGGVDDLSRAKRFKSTGGCLENSKGSTIPCKSSTLPAALWQYIFCFVPPVFLGRLLRVNHTFNSYLTATDSSKNMASSSRNILQPLTPEAIWIASRRRFAPGLPRPLHGLRELDMWQLLVGRKCQRCGRIKDADTPVKPENPWEAGPGNSGVRIVWPFGIRCCGSCLQEVSKKEFELYISSCPSFLVPGIPFAFVTKDSHYIGHNLLKVQTAPPALEMTKHFYIPGIEEMVRRFENARTLGAASAEEWTKGLASEKQERLEEIIRWEQWESKGGLKRVNSRYQPKPGPAGAISTLQKASAIKDETHSGRSSPQSAISSTRHEAGYIPKPTDSLVNPVNLPLPTAASTAFQPPWSVTAQYPATSHQAMPTSTYHSRPERNIRDVNEAKAVRRAEIERRCSALNPPLTPNVLSHMESFQAAMQITQPMTDAAWQILKPRLLAQLPYAERKEKERVQQVELLAEESRQRRQQELQLKETKDTFDREWETFQNPVRNRLGTLADEVIDSNWGGGRDITKDTSPKFAADILLQVRERFYSDVVKEDEAAISAGMPIKIDPPNGPPTRKLILENMKWLFDTKIKPLTDHYQRELFLCNGCDGNFKFYGFEGVIQHYAAKHTTTLSMGNIVVHWRAEWPEHPPFNPNPSVAKTAYYKVPAPAHPVQGTSTSDPLASASQGGDAYPPESAPLLIPKQQDVSCYTSSTPANLRSGPNQDEQLSVISSNSHSGYPSYSGTAGYSGALNGFPTSAISYTPYTATTQGHMPQNYGSSYAVQQHYAAHAQGQPTMNTQSYFSGPSSGNYGHSQALPPPYQTSFQNGGLVTHGSTIPGSGPDLYQRQMDEMAKHAKDVFIGIGGVKDLPGSVRIYVVIQLTVSRFKATFPNDPSLSMFIDGLDHSAVMRPVRSVNGLGCKTCIQSGTGAKLFTLPHLVNHFRSVHVENAQLHGSAQVPELDWKTDMIDLPDASIISNLVGASGMTDTKLALIASVFQGLFPSPLPNLRGKTNTGPLPIYKRDLDLSTRGLPRTPTSATHDDLLHFEDFPGDQRQTQYHSALQSASHETFSQPLEPPGEDEYDPHRPALLGSIVRGVVGSSQPHKSTRPSLVQSAQAPSFQTQFDSSHQFSPTQADGIGSYEYVNRQRHNPDEGYYRRQSEPLEYKSRPQSPSSDFKRPFGAHMGARNADQTVPMHFDKLATYQLSTENGGGHHTGVNGDASIATKSLHREQQGASSPGPVDAADRFLSDLVSKANSPNLHSSRRLEQDTGFCLELPRHGGLQVNSQKNQVEEDGGYDELPANGALINERANDVAAHQLRKARSDLRNNVSSSQRPGSRTLYDDNHRPSSHAQTAHTSVSSSQILTMPHRLERAGNDGRQETNGNASTRPHNRSHVYQGTRAAHYGSMSGSPHEAPAQMPLYRPRSPVEEDRGNSVHRSQSPPSRRPHDYPEQIVSYQKAQPVRYEYVDDPDFREMQYHPRVEYVRVPIDYGDSRTRETPARYLVSRPVEPVEPQYIRYEQAYPGDPIERIYERNGQLYQASRRFLHEQNPRVTPSYAHGYES